MPTARRAQAIQNDQMKTKLQIILAMLTVAALVTNQPISVSASQSGEAKASEHAKQGKL
jgi:hypothetical protein